MWTELVFIPNLCFAAFFVGTMRFGCKVSFTKLKCISGNPDEAPPGQASLGRVLPRRTRRGGVLHESLGHDCLKAYVCILYASPCAPLLVLWPGEVEGTSLAMAQAKASPVPAHVPMFRVPTVLRRVPSAVPPTVVGACDRRRLGAPRAFPVRFFVTGTWWHAVCTIHERF